MKQRTSQNHPPRLHVGIIMDGNGRWASARGWPRIAGHRAGVEAVRRIVEAAPALGIDRLTLYAFSADNWRRPRSEVSALMKLLAEFIRREVSECLRQGVRLRFLGRRDRLPAAILAAIAEAESRTAGGRKLDLHLAVDYSSRDAMMRAARHLADVEEPTREQFLVALQAIEPSGAEARDVDLLIRTGGEQRLSDFLLWECAYAELHFSRIMWPDFAARDLESAVRDFHARQRRFGGLPRRAAS